MEEKCKKHNKLFRKDYIEFLNTIGLGDYSLVSIIDITIPLIKKTLKIYLK